MLCSHIIHRVSLDDKRITFRVTKTVDFEVYVKVRPLNGSWARHLDIQDTTDGGILHPRDAIIRQEVILSKHRKHNTLRINH